MIKSMTGFGKATVTRGAKKIVVEVKSLNSKQLDVNLKVPALYREKELEIRAMIKEALDRGKVDMTLAVENEGEDRAVAVRGRKGDLGAMSLADAVARIEEEIRTKAK